MSRKVINITHSANKYDILSQTPKNYNKENYFLKELQDKVDAEWSYRPNRVDVEFEQTRGEQDWEPIEVVIQSVLSEKGTAISNDTRNIVFRNILEDRFNIGNRFRFSEDYDLSKSQNIKNVWLVVNQNKVNMTSSVVVSRCNGTLISLFSKEDGTYERHEEPVIQGMDLTSVSFSYNEVAISPQSQLLVIAQHNKYTRQYKINQRFIVGYDKVYRIKAINKFYGNSTFNPEDVGLIRIYMELTETDEKYDNFNTRVAYQNELKNVVPVDPQEEVYIGFELPKVIPVFLPTKEIVFQPILIGSSDPATFTLECSLENLPQSASIDRYVHVEEENGKFTIQRIRDYVNGNLVMTWRANNSSYTTSLSMYMTDQ